MTQFDCCEVKVMLTYHANITDKINIILRVNMYNLCIVYRSLILKLTLMSRKGKFKGLYDYWMYWGCITICLNHSILQDSSTNQDFVTSISMFVYCSNLVPTIVMPNCKFFIWSLPSGKFVYTRERQEENSVGAKGLLSHKLHGVDNTGNVCVWEAESVLLYIILQIYYEDFKGRY